MVLTPPPHPPTHTPFDALNHPQSGTVSAHPALLQSKRAKGCRATTTSTLRHFTMAHKKGRRMQTIPYQKAAARAGSLRQMQQRHCLQMPAPESQTGARR